MSEKPIVLMEGWQLLALQGRPFQLRGYATDHPYLPGYRRYITTSRVLRIDEEQPEAETLNTIHRLRHLIRELAFDGAYPKQFLIADLVAQRHPRTGTWDARRNGAVLAKDLATMTSAILAMLAILDRENASDGVSQVAREPAS